jgi:two-component system, LytTR family, sensor kinase
MKKHFLLWIIYVSFILIYAYSLSTKDNPVHLPTFAYTQASLIMVFYYNYFYILPLFFTKYRLFAIGLSFFGICVYFGMRYLFTFKVNPYFGVRIFDSLTVKGFLASHTYLYVLYTVYALLFWYQKRTIRAERQLRLTETEMLSAKNKSLESENERIKADYNTLKSQINPHFLYNTLNFFYATVYEQHPQTANGIALLSDIMRYSLSPGDEQGRVPLSMEWEHLEKFIELNQLRYDEQLPVSLGREGDMTGVTIMPHLLITLVENAFKHGDLGRPMHIQLRVCDERLDFTVQNHIQQGGRKISEGGGMGLANIKRRLWHEYREQAVFDVSTTDDLFMVAMKLPVNHKQITGEQRAA